MQPSIYYQQILSFFPPTQRNNKAINNTLYIFNYFYWTYQNLKTLFVSTVCVHYFQEKKKRHLWNDDSSYYFIHLISHLINVKVLGKWQGGTKHLIEIYVQKN